MSTDRELLEAAAKAAGVGLYWPDEESFDEGLALPLGPLLIGRGRGKRDWEDWDPITDDGDALRLAVKLGMNVCFGANYVVVNGSAQMPTVNNAGDPYAATRHAIVRAAADIWKATS